ncbi:DUF551 domain-containing protein [Enterobacter kobei]|uniref:DUF551 domain-containing protein n=1 Tax=Enterobacter kobei TaxID=208224 RepID=UPI001E585BFF|nr:DUF551 domain-containing protein [Enterobacter kobei]MCD2483544.1 DUF551 domain-containing protein [Enterobacter kobei]MCD2510667.1 DUF551 domain-containing protein [Enterobacter kobei]
MSTITRELAKLFRKITNSEIDAEGNAHVVLSPADSLLINNARIALASLEAEPVAWAHRLINKRNGVVHPWVYGSAEACPSEGDIFNIEVMPLYTAPPAPVSVPAAMEIDDDFDSAFEHGKAVGWNAYRAAMLQAEPVSNSDELPLDYLQGHKDGLEWAAQLAEANHPQTGDWLYDDPIDLARAISKGPDMPTAQAGNHTEQHLDMVDHSGDANKMVAGNSPVIPDGWKLVPIDPTKDMLRAGQSVVGFWLNTVHCYSKMLAAAPAAPKQEVTQALAKGMERYGDAMQKLADSGD